MKNGGNWRRYFLNNETSVQRTAYSQERGSQNSGARSQNILVYSKESKKDKEVGA